MEALNRHAPQKR